MDYQQVISRLQAAYNQEKARERDQEDKQDWKLAVRQDFLALVKQEGMQTLLEVGAGTGTDSLFFQNNGLRVTSTDLSPDMIALCKEKGLNAYVMDFLSLDFLPASFDAIYSMNCLLHVPTSDLPAVLEKLQSLLRPGGLFFLGVYGGQNEEGINEHDWHNPPRFFSFHTEAFMRQAVTPFFEIISFKIISLNENKWHFQAIQLRRN